ncbi:MAG: hypothetical protein PHF84_01360 [bacterium]|nr:hypothetical protein [bacterium]
MKATKWLKGWVQKRIRYYESFLLKNPDTDLRKEIAETIKHLRELV